MPKSNPSWNTAYRIFEFTSKDLHMKDISQKDKMAQNYLKLIWNLSERITRRIDLTATRNSLYYVALLLACFVKPLSGNMILHTVLQHCTTHNVCLVLKRKENSLSFTMVQTAYKLPQNLIDFLRLYSVTYSLTYVDFSIGALVVKW